MVFVPVKHPVECVLVGVGKLFNVSCHCCSSRLLASLSAISSMFCKLDCMGYFTFLMHQLCMSCNSELSLMFGTVVSQ